MKTQRDTPLRQALRQTAALPDPRPAESFWEDFRARTTLTMQAAPERIAVVGGSLLSPRWVLAIAAVLVALGLALVFLRPAEPPLQFVRTPPVAAPPALSKVEEVEVFSEYSSVMIMEDIENGGTVIWVASSAP